MPAFEDEELKRGEAMPEHLRDAFLEKKERARQRELEELEEMLEEEE